MDYQRTREEIEFRRKELLQRRAQLRDLSFLEMTEEHQIEAELEGLDQMLAGTYTAFRRSVPERSVPRLTEYILKLLKETEVPLTARQIRDRCVEVGIKAASRRSLLMSVYTVLKRHHSEIRPTKRNGTLTYFPRPSLRKDPSRHDR
jgi:hypothetical protein